ncbi:MAG TPA: glutathione S-transferase family protein [Nannocystaceae bacterium]|nr:glutathione S-transferase family protein [Nannocystaceae bacterium]
MGHLERGVWFPDDNFPTDKAGAFLRAAASFRGRVSSDGSTPHPVAAGRYVLYVSYACPWAHRTLIARALLGLEDAIEIAVVHPYMGRDGWSFAEGDGVVPDPIHAAAFLRDVYVAAAPDYTGRVTVPVLWDRVAHTIVCNESREILRMLSTELASLGHGRRELAPVALRERIDAVIDQNYNPINNGVYRAGFARSQAAYEAAVHPLFDALAYWEEVLAKQRFTCGAQLTEADICLFTTLLRFDAVYHGHFKCNLRRIIDLPNLWGFVRDVYQTPGVAATCRLDHIKTHYYRSHTHINPSGVVPAGPVIDFDAPHGRG